MFNFLWKPKNVEFNLQPSYHIIEFLTEDQKVLKDKAL